MYAQPDKSFRGCSLITWGIQGGANLIKSHSGGRGLCKYRVIFFAKNWCETALSYVIKSTRMFIYLYCFQIPSSTDTYTLENLFCGSRYQLYVTAYNGYVIISKESLLSSTLVGQNEVTMVS